MTKEDTIFSYFAGALAIAVIIVVYLKVRKNMSDIQRPVWDLKSEFKIKELHPKIQNDVRAFINTAEDRGIFLRLTSGARTFAEQEKIYNQGRTTAGKIVTNAKAGDSIHNYNLAFDVVEMQDKKTPIWRNDNWATIGEIGKSFGFEWGGDWRSFKDLPHFQKMFGNSLAMLKQRYNSGEFDSTGFVVV